MAKTRGAAGKTEREHDVRALLQRAVEHHGAGRIDEAEPLYRQALEIQPDHPVGLHLLGVVAHQRGDNARAVDLIGKALRLQPTYAQAHNNLGLALFALGRAAEAAASHRAAIAVQPDLAEAHSNLAVALSATGQREAALDAVNEALRINPGLADALVNKCMILRDLERFDAAMAAGARAVEVRPDDARAHYNFGLARKDGGDHDGAAESYRRATDLAPDFAEAHNNLGNVLQTLDRAEEAVASYRAALALRPDDPEIHRNLGNALASMGQKAAAETAYRGAIAVNPDDGESYRLLGTLKMFTDDDAEPLEIEALYNRLPHDDDARMHLAYALGKIYHDRKAFDRAFDFLSEGNALHRSRQDYDIEAESRAFASLKATVNAGFLSRLHGGGVADGTPVFIVGMPRSGTSLVEQILSSHPRVRGAGELPDWERCVHNHFGTPLGARLADATKRDFTELGHAYLAALQRFSGDGGTDRVTDKMPGNFKYIGLIRLALPEAKIIHCRRDPLDVCLSHFRTYFSESGLGYSTDLRDLGRYYRLYDDLMAHWRRVLPDAFHEVRYETLVADLENEARAMLAYCGLEWDDACLSFHRTKRRVNTASWNQVREPVHGRSVQLWKRYESHLAPLREALGD